MDKGRHVNIYIRADDAELWAWVEAHAKARRMALNQFIAMVLEQYRAEAED